MSIPKETQLEKEVKVYQTLNPTKSKKEKPYMQWWTHCSDNSDQEVMVADGNDIQLVVSSAKDALEKEFEERDADSNAPSQKMTLLPRQQKDAELGELKSQLDRLEENVNQMVRLLLANKSSSYPLPLEFQITIPVATSKQVLS